VDPEGRRGRREERGPSVRKTLIAFALGFLPVVALRVVQLLSVATELHDPEFLHFGLAALDAHEGLMPAELTVADLGRYMYGSTAQGTLVMSAIAWALEPWFGPSAWVLFGIAIAAQGATVGFLTAALAPHVGLARSALAAGLIWLFAPGDAVLWELMPFGNHTEFVWVAAAVLFVFSRDPALARWVSRIAMLVLLTIGIVCYRGHLPTLLAAAGAWGLSRPRRILPAAIGGGLVLAGVVYIAQPLAEPGNDSVKAVLMTKLWPHASVEIAIQTARRSFPSAPAAAADGALYGGVLACGIPLMLLAVWRTKSPALRRCSAVAALWCGLTVAAAFPFAPWPQYWLTALYAGLTAATLLAATTPLRWTWLPAAAVVVFLVSAGVMDASRLVRPEAMSANLEYRGLEVWHRLDVGAIDASHQPALHRLLDEGRGSRAVGVGMPLHSMCNARLRGGLGPTDEYRGEPCRCWKPGELGPVAKSARDGRPAEFSLADVGRGAAIACGGDLEKVRAAAEGLGPEEIELLLAGAREEAALMEAPVPPR
jgi:hypothetical protein